MLVGGLVAGSYDCVVWATVVDCTRNMSVNSGQTWQNSCAFTSAQGAAFIQLVDQVSVPVILDLPRLRLATLALIVSSLSLALFLLLVGQWPVGAPRWSPSP